MSSADRPGPADHSLLAAGTAAYDCHDFEALDKVPDALRDVVATLTELGFSTVAESPGYALGPAIDDLWAAVERTAAAAPVVVVYYTGHGTHLERDTYYLVTRHEAALRAAAPGESMTLCNRRRARICTRVHAGVYGAVSGRSWRMAPGSPDPAARLVIVRPGRCRVRPASKIGHARSRNEAIRLGAASGGRGSHGWPDPDLLPCGHGHA